MLYLTEQADFELGSIALTATASANTGNASAGALSMTGQAAVTLVQQRALQVVLEADNTTRVSTAGKAYRLVGVLCFVLD